MTIETTCSQIATTPRLLIRQLTLVDAPFVQRLVNEPSWLQFIGDKQVQNLADAQRYLETGPLRSYAADGFGMYLVAERSSHTPMGMCGLLKRAELTDVDIGFAFLPEFWGQGYALEASQSVVAYGRDTLGLQRLLAITLPTNAASIGLLTRLGFRREDSVQFPGDDEFLELYATDLSQAKP